MVLFWHPQVTVPFCAKVQGKVFLVSCVSLSCLTGVCEEFLNGIVPSPDKIGDAVLARLRLTRFTEPKG
jgi:hypothetical protein